MNLAEQFAALMAARDGRWELSEPVDVPGARGPRKGTPYTSKPGPRPRKSLGAAASPVLTNAERQQRHRASKRKEREHRIAILDMETDPFDADKELHIAPFLAVLYSDDFEPVVIWDADETRFTRRVIAAIEKLPEQYTVYAHNGGRFDYLFLLHQLRGAVAFKGRGIMSARVGAHELRDSFHIIPERLANWQKDKFDYTKLKKASREQHRAEIIRYCIADCRYLLDLVKRFVAGFGLKLTIGQAAMTELRKSYDVPKFTEGFDTHIREYFFGGRVECLRGRGEFTGPYKLYDVNSLYPHVMAAYSHPVGDDNAYSMRYGEPNENTVFIDLECRNKGALIARNDAGETTACIPSGRFRTTIWEYNVARKFKLIDDVKINICVDCSRRSNFSDFVLPLYDNRLRTKQTLDEMKRAGLESTAQFFDVKAEDIFYKLLLNNAYGKFAINPRRFKEHYLTDPDTTPPPEWFKSTERLPDAERKSLDLPAFKGDRYWIWEKPNPGFRYVNVGVAASITGAARAVLLEALQNARDPIYCDTDSIICRDLTAVHLSKTELGAWDLEDEFSKVIINGKKLYSTEFMTPKRRSPEQLADGLSPDYVVKSKGASRLTWANMEHLLNGGTVETRNRGVTLDRFGEQYYVKRTIRATAPVLEISTQT